jgi:hypothetical protein
LKRAREKRDDARRAVADGIDPGAKRRAERDAVANTFEAVADEWLLTKKASLTESTWERDRQQIHKCMVPYLGSKPIGSIVAPDLLEVLKRIESKGVIDAAHRTREVCGRIFRYAIATGRAKHDIAADLVGALAPRTTTHRRTPAVRFSRDRRRGPTDEREHVEWRNPSPWLLRRGNDVSRLSICG